MDQQLVCNPALSNAQSVAGSAHSNGDAGLPYNVPAVLDADSANGRNENPIKTMAFNLLPPAAIAVVISFWAFGPAEWISNPLSIVVAGLLTTAFVQVLELFRERHAGWRLNPREFATDLFYLTLSYTVIASASSLLAEEPLKAAKASLGITTPWVMHLPFVLQVALVVFLIEFGQYWMHRLMHNNAFFWSTHAPHHHLTQLNAMKGAVGNPIELFLISLSVVALFDVPQAALFCGLNVLGVVSTFAHANVRSDPPKWYSFVFTTIQHHSLHHSTGYDETRSNYGNSLILLDRIFGTYRDGEGIIVGQDERKRLSIWEQTIFPARPLIAKFNEKRERSGSTPAVN